MQLSFLQAEHMHRQWQDQVLVICLFWSLLTKRTGYCTPATTKAKIRHGYVYMLWEFELVEQLIYLLISRTDFQHRNNLLKTDI